ncbi:cell envelope integrity protein CreD [Flavobacterium rhizosphaerae]|uniref:Cell envelope integrity protein CreD n=1 Tax=Flavobacterium rhizosphaerae TaxID=3163298 RepID=A0ABW8YXV0_9FLAO
MELNTQHQPPYQKPGTNFLQSTTSRVIIIGLLTLALLIPLQFVKNLIWERQQLQEDVTDEIAKQWGGEVYFYGPILKVPYKVFDETEIVDTNTKKVTIKRTATIRNAYFFPETLNANAKVDTGRKSRGNYETTVFTSTMILDGSYTSPDFNNTDIKPENIHWDKASVLVKTNDLKNIRGGAEITLNSKKYTFEPGVDNEDSTMLETKPLGLNEDGLKAVTFKMEMGFNGTKKLRLVPIGKTTQATMASNWADPKFDGNYLPESQSVTDKGFTASWKITSLNRPFVQQHFGNLPSLEKYSFDTEFIILNDEYQQTERAAKYGFLVIGLTFLVFFLIQTVSKISIHIFQYSMIGLALIIFYTLLISITEHSTFRFAYLVAGVAVIVMIGLYSYSILKSIKFPLFIVLALTALYGFIYIIIQLENYALLAGSIGLFLILGAVMYFSRKIDWNHTKPLTA